MSGHVVGLAEAHIADRAAEWSLLCMCPHVPCEFVCPSEAPADTDGTDMALCFSLGGSFFFGTAFILRCSFFSVLILNIIFTFFILRITIIRVCTVLSNIIIDINTLIIIFVY